MTLLDTFKQQLGQLGELRRVWLTSFNLNIAFVETYLLPAILGEETPRDRLGFEVLQMALVEKGIDLRIFCDKRMLGADQYKRTAIAVHPISARAFNEVEGIGEQSLFHPKVMFLEDQTGKMILGAGSSNLTLGGWGRNQELFVFREITHREQYREVRAFFEALTEPLALDEYWRDRRFASGDADWHFIHSFQRDSFLQQMMASHAVNSLQVWSPFLSADLPDLLAQLRELSGNPQLTVALVADRLEGQYFRTPWSESLEACLDQQHLAFHERPQPRDERFESTHAKAWLFRASSGQRLAIGSWNFTHQGASSFELRNIEAGIVLNAPARASVLGAVLSVGQNDFASPELLSLDALKLEPELPFDLQVHYDWEQACFYVSGQWFTGLPDNAYRVRLPGIEQPIALQWRSRKSNGSYPLQSIERICPDNQSLLADHCYSVLPAGQDTVLHRGLVVETGQQFRCAQGFESIKDLLDSLINRVEPHAENNLTLRPGLRTAAGPDEDLALPEVAVEHDALSYFRLFQAIEVFRERLRATGDLETLQKWLFSYPGCLQALAGMARQQCQDNPPRVFDWFLAQEINSLHELACQLYRQHKRRQPPAERWSTLTVALPVLPQPLAEHLDYMKQVQQECGYAGQ